MAEEGMLALREALGKIFYSEHGDVLCESVALVVREVMEAEVARLALRALAAACGVSQWLSAAGVGHAPGHARACRPAAALGQLSAEFP